MRFFNNANAEFDVAINPFTRKIIIVNLESKDSYVYTYEDIDEWFSYSFQNRMYDFHILYDDGLDFSIYPVINNKGDYTKSVPYNLDVII
jgi:hypothetical protein